jgi:aspartyl-tRNA synthetase
MGRCCACSSLGAALCTGVLSPHCDCAAVPLTLCCRRCGAACTVQSGDDAPGTAVTSRPLPSSLPRLTYAEVMGRYGSDKPDRRFGLPIHDVTATIRAATGSDASGGGSGGGGGTGTTGFAPIDSVLHLSGITGGVHAIVVPKLSSLLSRKAVTELEAVLAGHARGGVAVSVVRVDSGGTWKAAVSKHVSRHVQLAVNAAVGACDGDLVLLSAGSGPAPCAALGHARLAVRDVCVAKGVALPPEPAVATAMGWPIDGSGHCNDVFWVTQFPLFEPSDDKVGMMAGGACGDASATVALPSLLCCSLIVALEGLCDRLGCACYRVPRAHPCRYVARHPRPSRCVAVPAGLQSTHHPFTAPVAAHEAVVRDPSATPQQLLTVTAQHYDLVLNGVEVAGGSIR